MHGSSIGLSHSKANSIADVPITPKPRDRGQRSTTIRLNSAGKMELSLVRESSLKSLSYYGRKAAMSDDGSGRFNAAQLYVNFSFSVCLRMSTATFSMNVNW